MAATITGASLSDIYERLNDLPSYNPMSSDTFSDWSTEAGDMVTMVRDEEEYEVPVHSSRMIWRGSPEISLSATGKKQRDPVASVSKAKYGRGSGMNNNQENSKKTGNKVFTGMDTPQDANEGDIWVKSPLVRTWDEGEFDWDSTTNLSWPDLAGSKNYVYKDGVWKLTMDEQVLIDKQDFYKTKESLGLLAARVVANQEQSRAEFARLDVRADAITATVIEAVQGLGSEIYQTATQIRSEVHAAGSTLYSYIDQTATYIRSEVADVANGLRSSITQTASQIRSEVNASNSQIYSSITQTASSIRLEVASSVSSLSSSITQTASQIRSEVNASNSQIYSSITQTASSIRMEVASSVSNLQSSITQESNRISLVVQGTGSNAKIKPASIVAAINDGESSIVISATHINLNGYVKTTDLTTDWLSAKIAGIDSVGVKNLAASGSIAIKENNVYYGIQRSINELNISLSGNTYTLQYKKWDDTDWQSAGTFSRATSLSAGWDGNRKFTVSASPQGVSRYTELRSSVPNAKASWSNSVGTLTIEASIDGGETFVDTGTVTVNAPTDQGNNAGNVSLGSAEATTSRPSGTELASWRTAINSAISGRKYFKFKATLTNGSGSKWYYINFE